jgi:transposase InsO family protein
VVCCIIKARESDTYRSNKGWPSALLKLKYDVSYQQVYTWVKKYSELGEAGLEDRRGRRAAQQEPRTKEEEMQAEIARLKHELYMSNMERDLLKKGYRRIRDDLERYHDTPVNDKRVLRICRSLSIKSTIKYANNGCTRRASNPQHIAENLLNRKFHADAPNQKWLTDVTEFKYYIGLEKHKVYLSAILDLYDRRIVSYVIRDTNDNPLVFETFDRAVAENPDAHPMFHSDRGFQYTSRAFHTRLEKAGMAQSMSRVGKCIDNGPMEGFWGILKRERYYGRRFTSREELVQMIENYIVYYNTKRLQRGLGILTPLEKHQLYLAA